jgi:hypothetical protein
VGVAPILDEGGGRVGSSQDYRVPDGGQHQILPNILRALNVSMGQGLRRNGLEGGQCAVPMSGGIVARGWGPNAVRE